MRRLARRLSVMFLTALLLLSNNSPLLGTEFSAPTAQPQQARFASIDTVVQDAIGRQQLPGAVVLVLHRGDLVFRKAYGLRSKAPKEMPMTVDTVFDLASLTKPIATATSLMILAERGKLKLTDRVAQYLPAFGQNGKENITIEQLLLHTSGLLADNPEADYRDGRAKALERIDRLVPRTPPGTRFTYSDVNYIVLGELVTHLANLALDEFARDNIFVPLGMNETMFRPPGALASRAAPTEQRNGHWMIGEVHDPRAYLLGGVAGHAGLFSTADDLAIYAQMILRGGEYRGKRILSPQSVKTMTTPHAVPGGLRAYGWDVQTAFSSNRGDVFPRGKSFGHTGFTGTSIWIDPTTDTAVIFLSNRVHPNGKGDVKRLRGQVATLAATAVLDNRPLNHSPATTRHSPTLTGIDVLVKEHFRRLKGRRIGLVTNHTGINGEGRSTIDLLHKAEGVTLVALFSPEHGIRGALDEKVADARDEKTGLPIYSLYGARKKPTPETLKGVDTLVFDIQDAGCRFYTYISTLGLVMETAAESKAWLSSPLRVVVLDRPNPIGGLAVEGPMLDAGRESFVAFHRLPVRYGMTIGELARLYKGERGLDVDLEVVAMENWRRGDFYDLPWINPSPNLRSLTETLLYPGIG
ncbi:MAG TPA: exo-beta-N-acetylmuramidase NamZ domain-containing protein, partial [Gemmataceae bacterium]|nr:exo-beta-N-acetylmuramidase NamZ domain-containing protein [Gemmataceae bacterium]